MLNIRRSNVFDKFVLIVISKRIYFKGVAVTLVTVYFYLLIFLKPLYASLIKHEPGKAKKCQKINLDID